MPDINMQKKRMKVSKWLSNHGLGRIRARIRNLTFLNGDKTERTSRLISNGSIQEISSRLSRLYVDLEKSCKSVEPDFIRLGEDLQAVYSGADDLMRQMSASITLIGGDTDESLLAKVGTIAKESLKEFKECQARVYESLRGVEIVVVQLTNLYAQGKMIEKIAMFLRVVGLNVGIETSRSPEAMELFGVVAQEIKALSEKAIDIVKKFLDESESAEAGQIKTHKEITKDLDPLRKLADDAEKGACDAVGQIESFMGLTLKALEKAGEYSRKISRQVGEIVMGIQFHDDMSQRIEHITRSLSDVERLCQQETSFSASGKASTAAERLSSAHSILALQIAQLTQVIAEINEVYQKTMRAFRKITDEIGNLAGTLATMGSKITENGNAVKGQNKDPFSDLKSALEHLQKIHKQGTAMFDRIDGTAAKASEATKILSNHAKQVSEISFATHLMALNAIVKAAHIGDKGSTLEVLAQEVKRLTDQSKEFVGTVEMIFESFTISAQLTTGAFEDGSEATSGSMAGISLEEGVCEISNGYETFKEDSQKALERAESLKDAISQTSDGLNFLQDLAVNLNEHLGQLEEIGEALSPWADQSDGEAVSETVKLSRRYTMHKEREIHQQLLGPSEDLNTENKDEIASDSCMAESKIVKYASSSNSAVFHEELRQENVLEDNVELFLDKDDPEEKDAGIRRKLFKEDKEAQVLEPAEKVELFKDQKTATTVTEDEFGDNVELF